MNRTPSENTKPLFLYAGTPTSAATSAEIDTLGFDNGHVTIALSTIAAAGADVTLIHVEESDASGSGFADVTDAAFTAITTANDGTSQFASLQLRARKRYLRVSLTGGGSNDAGVVLNAVLEGARVTSDNDATFVFEV